ncbi:MAG: hypothetical protein J2P18_11435 [Nocardia sp.]|nr:hypothetical protein [Nocardia sp.]
MRSTADSNPVTTDFPAVHIEGFTGALYLDTAHEADRYHFAHADIEQVLSSEKDTRRLIDALINDCRY